MAALEGAAICELRRPLEPADGFGERDPELVTIKPAACAPAAVRQFVAPLPIATWCAKSRL
jgi:hypothetical protein